MKRLTTIALVLLLSAAGCTSYRSYEAAREQELLKNWDQAVALYSKALEVDPDNMRYRMALARTKLEASRVHFEKGKSLREADQLELAAIELELTVKLDPTNQYAAVELGKVVKALQEKRSQASEETIAQMKKRAVTKAQPPQLNPASQEPISLSFSKPTPVKDIYRALGNAFGINVLFDQSVKDDQKVSIELRDVTAQQALERVMQAASHFYKVLDEKTIIVVPDTPQNRRDYEDLVIRTFYLSNGDAEQVTNVVRTMIEARNVFPLKALNAITIRDTADKVRIAEKIIEANDKAKAEVVVDVELLQMDVTRGRELGLQLVGSTGAAYTPGQTLVNGAGEAVGSLTLDQFKDLGPYSWSLNVPSVLYGFVKSNSDAKLLAKPQLRISEGEKASLHIGQKIPVPISTFTSANPGTGGNTFAPVTSFQYQDIGIKITIEPRVHHNREITLKLTVEVSNQAGFAPSTNPPQPIIGTRTIESTIRLKDGETNFLAGLIQQNENVSNNGVPFLSDIPILGRLFSKEKKDTANTDLVLTMTPHIIRVPDITEDDLAPMWVGTINNLTFRGVSPRLESSVGVDPFNNNQPRRPVPIQSITPQAVQDQMQDEPQQQAPQNAPGGFVPTGGSGPSNPFNPPQQPQPQPVPVPDQNPEQSRLEIQPQQYTVSLSPRISPQPSQLELKPGEVADWSLVGMDLDGLTTPSIVLHYDPTAMEVSSVGFGDALAIDPLAPPVVRLNAADGILSITSSNGKPLQFRSGGAIAILRVRGSALPSATLLALEPMELKDAAGMTVQAAVAGGRAEIQ